VHHHLVAQQPDEIAARDLAFGDRATGGIRVVPTYPLSDARYVERDASGRWAIPERFADRLFLDTPVLGVSWLAAQEYAAWRTRKAGGRLRFKLPCDLEWEKVARGVDRRIHVWGDYFFWSLCWSSHAFPYRPLPRCGAFPVDESVYGVRDLAGSMEEYSGDSGEDGRVFRRGGSWRNFDEENFRAANRNGREPDGRGSDATIQLVAELVEP